MYKVFLNLTYALIPLFRSHRAPDVKISYFNKALLLGVQNYKKLFSLTVFMADSAGEET
jgi:hypothetical protein